LVLFIFVKNIMDLAAELKELKEEKKMLLGQLNDIYNDPAKPSLGYKDRVNGPQQERLRRAEHVHRERGDRPRRRRRQGCQGHCIGACWVFQASSGGLSR
jgi:hypothetical protein